VFDDLRDAFRDLLSGRVPPEDRRRVLHAMKESLVHARLAIDDLREGVARTERRLTVERSELETVRRRKTLAEKIGDAETVAVASRFEAQHAERVHALELKFAGETAELQLAEREVEEMTRQFKAAQAGVGSGMAAGTVPSDDVGAEPGLEASFDELSRSRRRAAAEDDAEARLAELKRRMGR
jgi:hypothetical protein